MPQVVTNLDIEELFKMSRTIFNTTESVTYRENLKTSPFEKLMKIYLI